jgi:hypothetical protein
MNTNQHIQYMDTNFQILYAEQEFIIHPAALGLLPGTADALEQAYHCSFYLKDYQLMLDTMTLTNGLQAITDNLPDATEKRYQFKDLAVSYNGAIIIGWDKVSEYELKNVKPVCFSYRRVYELVFEDGVLITTVDQSKAMLRIRKNIELGLRSLSKNRDIRCIRRFMNSSFVGDYRPFLTLNRRFRYLKEMKKDYLKKEVSFSEKS